MSVVVDQMTHMPIALLEDRNGEALDTVSYTHLTLPTNSRV